MLKKKKQKKNEHIKCSHRGWVVKEAWSGERVKYVNKSPFDDSIFQFFELTRETKYSLNPRSPTSILPSEIPHCKRKGEDKLCTNVTLLNDGLQIQHLTCRE